MYFKLGLNKQFFLLFVTESFIFLHLTHFNILWLYKEMLQNESGKK